MLPNTNTLINFLTLSYLKSGNKKQAKAYQVLDKNNIFIKLAPYNPILVGTIPINIDISSSDLDIICYVHDNQQFASNLNTYFGAEKGFKMIESSARSAIIANFFIDDFEIEIFGQGTITTQQSAYKHMLIEHKLLIEKGEKFRKEIIQLKQQSFKTEPAFAKLMGIQGNPYTALLSYE